MRGVKPHLYWPDHDGEQVEAVALMRGVAEEKWKFPLQVRVL